MAEAEAEASASTKPNVRFRANRQCLFMALNGDDE